MVLQLLSQTNWQLFHVNCTNYRSGPHVEISETLTVADPTTSHIVGYFIYEIKWRKHRPERIKTVYTSNVIRLSVSNIHFQVFE